MSDDAPAFQVFAIVEYKSMWELTEEGNAPLIPPDPDEDPDDLHAEEPGVDYGVAPGDAEWSEIRYRYVETYSDRAPAVEAARRELTQGAVGAIVVVKHRGDRVATDTLDQHHHRRDLPEDETFV